MPDLVAAGISPGRWPSASTILPPGETARRKSLFPSRKFGENPFVSDPFRARGAKCQFPRSGLASYHDIFKTL